MELVEIWDPQCGHVWMRRWLDEILGEVKTSRQEQTLLSDHSSDHADRIERLKKATLLDST